MALAAVGLQTAIWNNNIKSVILVALYPFILASMVWVIAVLFGASMSYGMANNADQAIIWHRSMRFGTAMVVHYAPLILTAVAVWFLISLAFHTQMIRMLSAAKPVERSQEPALYNLLENLCISRGITMPKLQIIESDALNAFSSGIGSKSYSITVTRGLMNTLKPDELESVLAHELTHILNNDVRLLIVSIIFVGMLGFAAQMVWSQIRWNMYCGGRRSRNDGGGKILMFLMVVDLVLWLGYLTTLVARFAIARERESMADEGGVELTKNPDAMMRALLRIEGHDQIPHAAADIAQMCVVNSRPFLGIFATHPEIPARVKRISQLTHTPVPVLGDSAAPEQAQAADAGARRNPWK